MHPSDTWQITEHGDGVVHRRDDEIRLTLPPGAAAAYHDAQISDYSLPARDFRNAPPLRLQVRARAEGELIGTAGFGFWNHAFVPGERSFRLPQAIWFSFGGPPNEIALARGVPGSGWKAGTFNARNWRFCALLPLAPLGFLLMRSKLIYNALWPFGQSAIGVNEAALAPELLDDFHSYSIEWRGDGAAFAVDGEVVLRTSRAPGNRLGFIAWIDNQFAIVTPQGRFGRGLLDIPAEQSLRLRDLSIEQLT